MRAAEGGESEGGVRRRAAESVSDAERQTGDRERCILSNNRGENRLIDSPVMEGRRGSGRSLRFLFDVGRSLR